MVKVRVIPCLDVKNGRVVKGINFLKDKGISVVKMGGKHMKKISIDGVYDYATSKHQSTIMDLIICKSAKMWIGDSSGANAIPIITKTPGVFCNYSLPVMCSNYRRGDLSIFKPHYFVKSGRYLSLSELITYEIDQISSGDELREKGIGFRSNSEDEILNLIRAGYKINVMGEKPTKHGSHIGDKNNLVARLSNTFIAGSNGHIEKTFLESFPGLSSNYEL